ncbi:MAG TPA: glycosyltransferase family A protein [Bryobacteraceae bacterium]|nr:glycosyltransferase family A protein [Bryobacteraceae bacterium]
MTPRASVVVPAYNAAAYLPYAIDSVLAQTYADWEIVIVDDGSIDHTRAMVDSYRLKLQDRLQYVYQSNQGVSAARNSGIRAARGEFIALLDADDVWLPQRLERGVAALDADPAVGLVHAKVARIDTRGLVTGQLKVEPKYLSGSIARHIYTRRAHLICTTVMFRKSCLAAAGWFDEAMQTTEDRDLWFRIALRYKIAYIGEVLAYYRISPTSTTANLERLLQWQLHFVAKHQKSGAASRLERLQALGNIYRELGDSLFRGGAVTQSIGSYLRAVGYYPLSVPNVYMLFRAIMDPVVRVCVSATRLSNAGM